MFEKILVPIDGSEHSLRALTSATQLAKNSNGKISLLSVCKIEEETTFDSVGGDESLRTDSDASSMLSVHGAELRVASTMNPTAYSDVIKCMREASKQILANGEKSVKDAGVQVETLAREGNVVDEILKEAKSGKFNLVVMGSRGLSRIRELALGSVADAVMRHSPIPVLVVK